MQRAARIPRAVAPQSCSPPPCSRAHGGPPSVGCLLGLALEGLEFIELDLGAGAGRGGGAGDVDLLLVLVVVVVMVVVVVVVEVGGVVGVVVFAVVIVADVDVLAEEDVGGSCRTTTFHIRGPVASWNVWVEDEVVLAVFQDAVSICGTYLDIVVR